MAKYYSITSFEKGGVWPIYYSILHRGWGVSKRPQKVLRNICTAPYFLLGKGTMKVKSVLKAFFRALENHGVNLGEKDIFLFVLHIFFVFGENKIQE